MKEKFKLGTKKLHSTSDKGANVRKAARLTGMENELCIGHGIHNLVTEDGIKQVEQV